jgi:site-specific DNA-methyltransferase (adenine-specific)
MPDRTGLVLSGVFRHFADRDKEHATAKPVPLMRELVAICPPGAVILDPFMGGASTGVAAVTTGRRFVGIEMVKHYQRVAERLIRTARLHAMPKGDQAALEFEEVSGGLLVLAEEC